MSRAEQHLRDQAAGGDIAEPAERFFVMPMAGAKGAQKMAPAPGAGGKGKGKGKEAALDKEGDDPDPENGSNTVFLSLMAGWLGLGHEAHLIIEGVKTAIELADSRDEDKKINPDPKAAINPKFAFNFGKEAKPEPAMYGGSSKKNDEEMLTRLAKRRTSGSSMSGISMGRSPSSPGFR